MAPPNNPATINPLLDTLDIFSHPRPFKNPHYHAPARRNKNLKQILSDTANASRAANANSGTSTPLATDPNRSNPATSAPAAPASIQATYQNIESAPSLRRGNKWCDVTGLPAKYTDPKSKLRYVDGEVYRAVRGLPAGGAERYLEVRGANVVLK